MAERKGKKLRRCAKHKNYYAVQAKRTDQNKKRRIGKHIRNHPDDVQAVHIYEKVKNYGSASGQIANATARGRKRQHRHKTQALRKRVLEARGG